MYSNKWVRFSLIFFVFFMLFGLNAHSSVFAEESSQDGSSATFCLLNIPSAGTFPKVNLEFRVFDNSLVPVQNIVGQDIQISENGATPVSLSNGLQSNAQGVGLDFYVLINRSNRTDQAAVKTGLNSFLNAYVSEKDNFFIYTDDSVNHGAREYYVPDPTKSLVETITDYPTANSRNYFTADKSVLDVLAKVEGNNTCQRPRFLILFLGDGMVDDNLLTQVLQRVQESNTKLILFHVPTVSGGKLNDASRYRSVTQQGGFYFSSLDDNSNAFVSITSPYRQSFSTSYNSNLGDDGVHDVAFLYHGTRVSTEGNTQYSTTILPPTIALHVPSTVERTAQQVTDTGYTYDNTSATLTVDVSFPDGILREINKKAVLTITKDGGLSENREVTLSKVSDNEYQLIWNFGNLGDEQQQSFSLQLNITDSFDLPSASEASPSIVLSYVPMNLMAERYIVYILLVVVFVLSVLMVIIWRRGGRVVQGVKNIGEQIRKTIVGGGKRGKPLASLHVTAGPPDVLNQDLTIYTERVNLGRDPQQADLTFYSPGAKTSISSLHARIERMNGTWRIVAVSNSQSQTFVDNESIPFHQPYTIHDGQKIRLGYPAMQPVEFEFHTDMPDEEDVLRKTEVNMTDINKTDVSSDTMPLGSFEAGETELGGLDDADDIFDEFR